MKKFSHDLRLYMGCKMRTYIFSLKYGLITAMWSADRYCVKCAKLACFSMSWEKWPTEHWATCCNTCTFVFVWENEMLNAYYRCSLLMKPLLFYQYVISMTKHLETHVVLHCLMFNTFLFDVFSCIQVIWVWVTC